MSNTTSNLKDDLILLKNRLETIESQLSGQMKEIETREHKWKSMEEKCQKIYTCQKDIVRFNVGGKKFSTTAKTLVNFPGTLFAKLIESGRLDLDKEIFLDRSAYMFPFILNYIRTGQINYKLLNNNQLTILKYDAEYYNLASIVRDLNERLKEIEFISFTTSGVYTSSGRTAGTNKIEDLKNRDCMKGICANSPGEITIELNAEWEFEALEIGGWKGDSSLWGSDNGAGATISTSTDKLAWKQVGFIPSGFGYDIKYVRLTRSSARFIKFDKTSYLGIGFLEIKKLGNETK
jgi:hypothetical protein